jgi:hypothetical protein
MFHIPEEHQELLFEMRPEAFEPLHWGKITRCFVNLKQLPAKELAALVREAWEYAGQANKARVGSRPTKAAKVPARRKQTRPGN